MNSGTPVSIPPGPFPSFGMSRATAALMNRHSSGEKNDGAKSTFLVSLAAATDVAEAEGRMAAGAKPRSNFRLFNMSGQLDCENAEERHKLHRRDLHSGGAPTLKI